jgi:putative transposase
MSTPVDKWEKEDTVITKTRKIRIYPNSQQKKIIKEWMNTCRYVYNKCLEGVKKGDNVNFFKLRNKYVIAKNNTLVKDWEVQTPKDVRAGSTKDLVTAYKTAIKNLNNGNISKFNIRYRSKKNGYQSIVIPKTAISLDNRFIEIYKSYEVGKIKTCKELIKKKKK